MFRLLVIVKTRAICDTAVPHPDVNDLTHTSQANHEVRQAFSYVLYACKSEQRAEQIICLLLMWRNTQSEATISDNSSEELSLGSLSYEPIAVDLAIENLTIQNNMADVKELTEQIKNLTGVIFKIGEKLEEHEVLLNNLSAVPIAESPNTNPAQSSDLGSMFKIPDPIKMLPAFNGNRKQLVCWLNTAEETLAIFENVVPAHIFRMYYTAVINKIEGHAKDILCVNGNPSSFSEVREILTEALGDKKELSSYNCQLWHNRMENSIEEHYKKTKQIVFNIKSLAKQNAKYNAQWDTINEFIDEYSLAAYISGLKKPYFGYAQAARPKSIEEAHAFLCKFTSNESNRHLNTVTGSVGVNNTSSDKTVKAHGLSHFKPVFKKDQTEPMEVESTKSRLTRNKGILNNNEIVSNTEDEELLVNFWEGYEEPKPK